MLYYGLTTVWGSQTLGEEYCNTVQVGPRRQSHEAQRFSAPGFLRRTLAVLVQLLGPYALEKLLEYLNRRVHGRSVPLDLSHRQYKVLESVLDLAEELVSTSSQLHLALFYIRGAFYHVGKRVAGVRYLMIRYGLDGSESSQSGSYRVLGWMIVCQVALKLLTWAWRLHRLRKLNTRQQDREVNGEERETNSDEGGLIITVARDTERTPQSDATARLQLKCPLCLEACQDITTTPCGHLFCWQCVAEWVSERSECPVCRSDVTPQALVALQHFDL